MGVRGRRCANVVPSIHGHGRRTLDVVLVDELLQSALPVPGTVADAARPLLLAKPGPPVLKPYLCVCGKG